MLLDKMLRDEMLCRDELPRDARRALNGSYMLGGAHRCFECS